MEKFRELGLEGEILKGVADLGFETPSPVQEKVIPVILGEENDLVALAQTGTGKTAAFGLPLLQKLNVAENEVQVLILSPTRELCVQIGNDPEELFEISSGHPDYLRLRGDGYSRQIRELERGVHVLVATPGRLCDLIKREAVNIEAVKAVVLDEADEMLNMGFKEDLNFILDATPRERNTYLFSATYAAGSRKNSPELSAFSPRNSCRKEKSRGRYGKTSILSGKSKRFLRDLTPCHRLCSGYVCYYFYPYKNRCP